MIRRLMILCLMLNNSHSFNVLIWSPTIGYSHIRFMGNVADILARDGHNVTIISPLIDPHVHMVGHTMTTVRLIPYVSKYCNTAEWLQLEIKGPGLWEIPLTQGRSLIMDDLEKFTRIMRKASQGIFEDIEFLNHLRAVQFDVALYELYGWSAVPVLELSTPSIIEWFSILLDIMIGIKKTVVMSTLGPTPYIQQVMGFPINPSYVPAFYTSYTDQMSFWERLDNFKFNIEMHFRMRSWKHQLWELANKASPGFPDFQDLVKRKTGVILMNVNEFTETPRPTTNIVRYIGGATIYEPKPLDEKLNAILDQRSQNVFFSLGSLVRSKDMPMWLKHDIVNAFASFPNTTFIWKYEDEGDKALLEKHPNIHIMKWVPQVDLLADRRLSLFITHAGKNSILEATSFGKPMVTIPLFADQILNAKNVNRRGLAVMIEKHNLDRNTLAAAVRDVLKDGKYARKAATVAKYLQGRPAVARAEISRWVKLVAEEGVMDHLVLKSADLSFIQYYCLDVITYLLIQFSFVSYLLFRSVKSLLRRFLPVFQRQKLE